MNEMNIFSRIKLDGVFQIEDKEIPGHLIYDIDGLFDSDSVFFQNKADYFDPVFLKLNCDLIINKHFYGNFNNTKISVFYPHSHFSGPESFEDAINGINGKKMTVCTAKLMMISKDGFFH